MFPKFIQVGLHLRDVYAGGALLFEILIGFHIWGAYILGGFYTGGGINRILRYIEIFFVSLQ